MKTAVNFRGFFTPFLHPQNKELTSIIYSIHSKQIKKEKYYLRKKRMDGKCG